MQSIKDLRLEELDSRIVQQVQSAKEVLQNNPKYALEITLSILERYPGVVEIRQILREAQEKVHGPQKKSLAQSLAGSAVSIRLQHSKSKPADQRLQLAEEVLSKNPYSLQAHQFLADAAKDANLIATEIFAYQNKVKLNSELKDYLSLIQLLVAADRGKEGLEVGHQALKHHAGNMELEDLVRKASVDQTMQKGHWESGGDFRGKLAELSDDADPETLTEQEQLAQKRTQLKEDPSKIEGWIELIDQYRNAGNFKEALKCCSGGFKGRKG